MDAASRSRDLYAVCTPAPLRPAPPATTRRHWPRVRFAAALAALLVIAGCAGVAWARSQAHHAATLVPHAAALGGPRLSPVSLPRPSAPSGEGWSAVMSRLDRTRDMAFATGNEAALRGVYAPGSAVLQRELAS